MSGIYIKGMEMPKNCSSCPFCVGENICPLVRDYAACIGRHKDCPIVPVPPHGDLIERDKLREKEFIHDGDAYAVVMSRDIRNAPTIIPEERRDNGERRSE